MRHSTGVPGRQDARSRRSWRADNELRAGESQGEGDLQLRDLRLLGRLRHSGGTRVHYDVLICGRRVSAIKGRHHGGMWLARFVARNRGSRGE